MPTFITLTSSAGDLLFQKAEIDFQLSAVSDMFTKKNNKSLEETVSHKKYEHLALIVRDCYPEALEQPLGSFLGSLKLKEDMFYKRFLNPYGDQTFCGFKLTVSEYSKKKGLYVFAVRDKIHYIGRCRDRFQKRITTGYGVIHPKNCYLDGQATNCHLNALIALVQTEVNFYVLPLEYDSEIIQLERELIQLYAPAWNIALK